MQDIDFEKDITDHELGEKKEFNVILNGFVDKSYLGVREWSGSARNGYTGKVLFLDGEPLLYVQSIDKWYKTMFSFEDLSHIANTAYVLNKSPDEIRAIYLYNEFEKCIPHKHIAEYNPARPTKEHLEKALRLLFKDKLIYEAGNRIHLIPVDEERYAQILSKSGQYASTNANWDKFVLARPIRDEDYARILSNYDQHAGWRPIEKDGWRLFKPNDGRNIVEDKRSIDFSEFFNSPCWDWLEPHYSANRSHVLTDTSIIDELPNFESHPKVYAGCLLQYEGLPAVYLEGYYRFLRKYHGFDGEEPCTLRDVIELLNEARVVDAKIPDISTVIQKATGENFTDIAEVEAHLTDEPLPLKFVGIILDIHVRPCFVRFTDEEEEKLSQVEELEGYEKRWEVKDLIYKQHKQEYAEVKEPILRLFDPDREDVAYNRPQNEHKLSQ